MGLTPRAQAGDPLHVDPPPPPASPCHGWTPQNLQDAGPGSVMTGLQQVHSLAQWVSVPQLPHLSNGVITMELPRGTAVRLTPPAE